MVAPPPPVGGSQTAFTYSSEPQAVPPKRSARSKYREEAAAMPPDPQWMDENEVRRCVACGAYSGVYIQGCYEYSYMQCSSKLEAGGYEYIGSPSTESVFDAFAFSPLHLVAEGRAVVLEMPSPASP